HRGGARRGHRRRHRARRERRVSCARARRVHDQRVHPRARSRPWPVRRHQASYPGRREDPHRRRDDPDCASQHLSPGGGLYGARRRGSGHRRRLRGAHRDPARAVQRAGIRQEASMRRGLMGWDQNELPKSALEARLARLKAAMAHDRFDAYLLYTNLVRPAEVCWLTGFPPSWIQSPLVVPGGGPPLPATALSKRVADWVKTTAWLDEIVNTPKPGTAVGQRLATLGAKRVGVLELDALPAGLYDDIVAAAPEAELIEASEAFAASRRVIDAAARKLIQRAGALALAALAQVDTATGMDSGALAGLAEKHARLVAAEEAYIAIAADLDADRRLVPVSESVPLGQRFAVRASIAYKGAWVRRTRTFARDTADRAAAAR